MEVGEVFKLYDSGSCSSFPTFMHGNVALPPKTSSSTLVSEEHAVQPHMAAQKRIEVFVYEHVKALVVTTRVCCVESVLQGFVFKTTSSCWFAHVSEEFSDMRYEDKIKQNAECFQGSRAGFFKGLESQTA
eukprot:1160831-Pelagomonas_calceolata.AAC.2